MASSTTRGCVAGNVFGAGFAVAPYRVRVQSSHQKKMINFDSVIPESFIKLRFTTLHRRQTLLLTFESKIATFLEHGGCGKVVYRNHNNVRLLTLARETFCREPTNTFAKPAFALCSPSSPLPLRAFARNRIVATRSQRSLRRPARHCNSIERIGLCGS